MKQTDVTRYILNNWDETIRDPAETLPHGIIKLPKPFTVPCMKEVFTDFYYWDTYFTNLGLFASGRDAQAENNLDTMLYLVQNLGFIPNANHLIDRSQPPLFTRGVYDLWQKRGDDGVIRKYIDGILAELSFFAHDRMTPCGLNQYSCHATRTGLLNQSGLIGRVGLTVEGEEARIAMTRDLLAVAESGWDFNPRYRTPESPFAAGEFVNVDLNSLLYDAERKAAAMLRAVGRRAEADVLDRKADTRRKLMLKLMRDPETGILYDYNFVRGELSCVASCASFYPFTMGISDDRDAARALLAKLELTFGLSACEARPGEGVYLQWDYPAMWPSNVCFACAGLESLGMHEDAARIAGKYLDMADALFEKTGSLWEKYDAAVGAVSVTGEYETPAMMGWTAGVYLVLQEKYRS
ncbi:MAG: alpha,alpha-trehalase [Clostridia bacterium]|nr:alpha,alpha-trehalase [Clostridia bacterium]